MDTLIVKVSHRPATCLPPETTTADASRAMVQNRVGACAVSLEDGTLLGMFSERDLMRRVVARGLDPKTTTVGQVMTREPVTVTQDTPLEGALEIMVTNDFRHLPIMDGPRVVGMATVRRVLKYKLDQSREELESVVSFFTADGIGG